MITPLRVTAFAFALLLAPTGAGIVHAATSQKSPAPTLPSDRPGSLAVLLGVESVRNALALTSLQRAVLDSIREEFRTSARRIVKKASPTPEGRAAGDAELSALIRYYNKRALNALNPKQKSRLEQIEHQILGGYLLLAPSVQSELQLTSAQKSKLAAIYAKWQKYVGKVSRWYADGEISHYERLVYLYEDRRSRGNAMLRILTPAQRSRFDALAGGSLRG